LVQLSTLALHILRECSLISTALCLYIISVFHHSLFSFVRLSLNKRTHRERLIYVEELVDGLYCISRISTAGFHLESVLREAAACRSSRAVRIVKIEATVGEVQVMIDDYRKRGGI
jgi:hypothetical protein